MKSSTKLPFPILQVLICFCPFQCPDYFVVGYGLDYAELYRNLPYVGVLKPEKYKKDSSN